MLRRNSNEPEVQKTLEEERAAVISVFEKVKEGKEKYKNKVDDEIASSKKNISAQEDRKKEKVEKEELLLQLNQAKSKNQQKLSKTEASIKVLEKKLEELDNELAKNRETIDNLKNKLNPNDENYVDINIKKNGTELTKKLSELERLKREIKGTKSELVKQESTKKKLEENTPRLDEEINDVESHIRKLDSSIKKNQANYEKEKTEIVRLRKIQHKLEEDIAEANLQINSLSPGLNTNVAEDHTVASVENQILPGDATHNEPQKSKEEKETEENKSQPLVSPVNDQSNQRSLVTRKPHGQVVLHPNDPHQLTTVWSNQNENLLKDFCETQNCTSSWSGQNQLVLTKDKDIQVCVTDSFVSANIPRDEEKQKQAIDLMVAVYLKSIEGCDVKSHTVKGDLTQFDSLVKLLAEKIAEKTPKADLEVVKINGKSLKEYLAKELIIEPEVKPSISVGLNK